MSRTKALIFAELLAAVLVWGSSFAATKIALREVSPVTVVWLRFAMGVVVLGATAWWRGELRLVPRGDALALALLGLQGITLHQWLQSTALVTTHASTGGWIAAATPACIALVGVLLLRERLTSGGWLGIALAAVGVLVVVTRGDVTTLVRGRFGEPGDILMVLSAPNWAFFSVFSRHTLRRQPAARAVFFIMLFGWLGTTGLFLSSGDTAQIAGLSARGWLAVAFLGVFCSGLAYAFWYDALARLAAWQVGAFLYLEPLAAVATGVLLVGERLDWATVVGGGVILAGVWLVNRRDVPRLSEDPALAPGGEGGSRHYD